MRAAATKVLFQILATISFTFVVLCAPAIACSSCRAQVSSNIYDETFARNFVVMMLPLLIVGLIGIGLFYANDLQRKAKARKLYGEK